MFENFKSKIIGSANKKTVAASPLVSAVKNLFYSKFIANSDNTLDKYEGWVFKCINLTATEVGAAELRLFEGRRGSGESKEITDPNDKTLKLLENPNPYQTKSEFLEAISASLDLDGNAFVYRVRVNGTGETQEMYCLRPDWVKVMPGNDSKEMISKYTYARNGHSQDTIDIEMAEMIHIKELNPKYFDKEHPYRGVGKVAAAMKLIIEDEKIKEWNSKFFDNGAAPHGVLEYEGSLPLEQIKRVQNAWKTQYAGAENAHETPFLQGGLKWKAVGSTQSELAFIDQRKLDRDDILAMFGVPKGLLLTDDVNLANATTAMWSFMRLTVRPRLKRIEGAFDRSIVMENGKQRYVEFDNVVPEDRDAEIREYTAAVNKWMTVNEIRAEEGLEPLDGYDTIVQPIAPGSAAPDNKPKPDNENDDDNAAENGADIADNEKGLKYHSATCHCDHHKGGKKKTEKSEWTERIIKGEAAWEEMIKKAGTYKVKYSKAIKIWLLECETEALKNAHGYKTINGLKLRKKDLINKKEKMAALIDLLTPLQREYLEKEGAQALRDLGIDMDFTITSDVSNIIDKWTVKLAGSVADTTEQDLRNLIVQAAEEHMTVAELSASISGYFDWANKVRADMIAQTESIRTGNMANVEAWKQSGVVTGKEWYTAQDETTCAYCDDQDGKIVQLETSFFQQGDVITIEGGGGMTLDYGDVDEPPLHVNCRCILLPYMENF